MEKTYYIASWHQGNNEGVTRIVYDIQNDLVLSKSLLHTIKRSSYFARNGQYLFVLTEATMAYPEEGAVTSLRIDSQGESIISRIEGIDSGLTHLSVSRDGRHLFASGYGTGCLYVIDVDPNGYLSNARKAFVNSGSSVNKIRQNASHLHFTTQMPDDEYICSCDLGTDEIIIFRCDENGDVKKTGTMKTPLGYGPRHMVFSKDGRYAYILCELTYHLLIYSYEGAGNLEFINDIDLFTDAPSDKRQCSAIRISDDGKTLFTANRAEGYNSLDAWDLSDPEEPVRICSFDKVCFPRDFILLEEGYVAVCNQPCNQIQFIRLKDGSFSETGKIEGIEEPVSIIEW